MGVTLAATGRIITHYVIDGLAHKQVAYVRNPTLVEGAYLINSRALDENDTPWEDIADQLAKGLGFIGPTGITFADSELQKRTGLIWTPVAFHTVTPPLTQGAYVKASECTITLRDVLFHPLKAVYMETIDIPPFHFVDPHGGSNYMDFLIDMWITTGGATPQMFDCVVSRGNQYINSSGFIACTCSYNHKLRKYRGTA
jgi:hypothetical protein